MCVCMGKTACGSDQVEHRAERRIVGGGKRIKDARGDVN